MRVLPGIESAEFDVPTEVFTLKAAPGTGSDRVMAAIRELGYEPHLLEGPVEAVARRTRLTDPKSAAVRKALARARKRAVALVADFGATWCGPCKAFARETLTDARVEEALRDFELLRIDIDEDPAATKDFGVAGVPDIWFVAPDGKILGRENRYMDADDFLAVLRRMKR